MKKMKTYVITAACIVMLCSGCKESVYVKHSLQAVKKGACAGDDAGVKMESNINGERYVFSECLPADFSDTAYKLVRSGDNIIVTFPHPQAANSNLFEIILDVQANPVYESITIGDRPAIKIRTITKF